MGPGRSWNIHTCPRARNAADGDLSCMKIMSRKFPLNLDPIIQVLLQSFENCESSWAHKLSDTDQPLQSLVCRNKKISFGIPKTNF